MKIRQKVFEIVPFQNSTQDIFFNRSEVIYCHFVFEKSLD